MHWNSHGKDWIARGGVLISEGLIGYFGDHGRVGTRQPNFGFDEVFGAREYDVEFMPDLDLGEEFKFNLADGSVKDIPGGLFQQSYTVGGGEILGSYSDGRVASVTRNYGKGTAILMGTFPLEAYYREASGKFLDLFKALLDRVSIKRRIIVEGASLTVRLCKGDSGHYIWFLNHASVPVSSKVFIAGFTKAGEQLWGRGFNSTR